MRVLVVDDGATSGQLATAVSRARPEVEIVEVRGDLSGKPTGAEGAVTVVLIGPGVADGPRGLDVVRSACRANPDAIVVVVGRRDSAGAAMGAIKAGAGDYVVLGDEAALVRAAFGAPSERRPARAARSVVQDGGPLAGLVGASPAMERVRALVRTAARTEAHVLIEGETGTGKEVVARALHALGRRAGGPFVPINCAAIPETLAESEFFGHARGAFTGALQERPGALQQADRGTLFLDEVEDLPLSLQAKLLRVVQDREVRPLGANVARRVDVRLVAASNRELWRMVEAGEFRRDLYYRLRVFSILLPPLRERRQDLPLLIEHFLVRLNARHGTALDAPAPAALRPLLEHSWPGNVRELENTLEALVILAGAGGTGLAEVLRESQTSPTQLVLDERARIVRVLDDHRWNRQRAAAALGISRVTLWRRMERHRIRDPLAPPVGETA